MEVRLTSGLNAGQTVDVPDDVANAFLVSGKAVPVEKAAEPAEVQESPEKPKRRRKVEPETR